MQNHLEYFLKKENDLKKDKNFSTELIKFYIDLFAFHNKYYGIFNEKKYDTVFTINDKPQFINNYKTLSGDLLIDLSNALYELTTIIRKYQKGIIFDAFLKKINDDKKIIIEYILQILKKNNSSAKSAEKLKISNDIFIFLIINSIKPLFISLKDSIGNKEEFYDEWLSSDCPVCGYYHDMAKLAGSKDGKRFLHCSLCENEWPFERLACTVCGNKNAKKLGFYTTEEESQYRIDYCDECKAYIKTVRVSKGKDHGMIDLHVENIITPHLDFLAMEKGLRKQ